jgi:hypothetical protein
MQKKTMTTRKRDKSPSPKSVGGSIRKIRWRSSNMLALFLMAATFQVTLWMRIMAYVLHGPETQAPTSSSSNANIQESTPNPLKHTFPIAFENPLKHTFPIAFDARLFPWIPSL